ncbi:MAG: site-specific integrase [Alphaproteobacteria bacterium]|nr:site-specific integrase [Alphaproteobacteria bacterium]
MAHKLCFHKASGRYYVFHNGARHYLGRDLGQARILRAQLIGKLTARAEVDAPLTVAEACLRFVREVIDLERCSNPWRYHLAIEAVCDQYASASVDEFRSVALGKVAERLLSQPSKRNPKLTLSHGYVSQLLTCVVSIWQWFVGQEIAKPETLHYLQSAKADRFRVGRSTPKITPPPEGAVEQTLPYLTQVLRDMVMLQLLTGCRPCEICQLSWDCIDRSGPVVDGVQVWVYRPIRHKTQHLGKSRVVGIGPRAQEILERYAGRNGVLFSPRESLEQLHRSFGWPTRNNPRIGQTWATTSYGQAIENGIKRANGLRAEQGKPFIPHWTPNQLRHAAATITSDRYDREHASALLGHSSIRTTEIYAEQAILKAARVVAEMG